MEQNRITPYSRRDMLKSVSCGFGMLAFAGIAKAAAAYSNPLAPRAPHFPPKVKRVIFMYMAGAPSQWETFDYSPELEKAESKETTVTTANGARRNGTLMAPRYKFAKQGESGLPISDRFPNLAKHADSLCILNGMHTDSAAHPQASILLHTGSFTFVRPSMGAWSIYGLGTENQNMPGFITINPSNTGGAQNYGSAFLPAPYQGTAVTVGDDMVPNIKNPNMSTDEQRKQLDFLQTLNRQYSNKAKVDGDLEGVIQSYELAFRMQATVPGLVSIDKETEATKEMYGLNETATKNFGTQCLLARRLAESGVRFIEIANDGWDHHNNLTTRMAANTRAIDKPIAALITDLKQRGLFEDTLIVWGGEFGRTPIGQNGDGRQHNSRGYSMWLAGGPIKGGMRYGMTDPTTGSAIADKVHLHDLHATMLHLLGLNHEKLTYRYAGRDFRLTDVHGRVVKEILS